VCVFEVRHRVGVVLGQHVLLDHDLDRVVGGHDDVVAGAAGAHLRQHRLVRVVVVERDLDVVLLLDLLDQLGIGVVAPVEDVQLTSGAGRASSEQEGDDSRPEQSQFHGCLLVAAAIAPRQRRRPTRKDSDTKSIETTSRIAEMALTSGVTPSLCSWPQMNRGSVVCPGPATSWVMVKSSNEMMKASAAPEEIPGVSNGKVTRRKACHGVA